MAGEAHFEIYEVELSEDERPAQRLAAKLAGGKRQEWRWRLRAANGEVVASGEGHRDERDVRRAVEAVVDTMIDASEWDLDTRLGAVGARIEVVDS